MLLNPKVTMNKKILLIDDEALVTKSLSRILQKEGYEVRVCHNGQEAISQVQSDRPDLIICDIRMPDLNGVEFVKKIRDLLKNSSKKPVPEILITGYADEKTTKEAEALKVREYLYKPFDLRDFLACVKNVLGS